MYMTEKEFKKQQDLLVKEYDSKNEKLRKDFLNGSLTLLEFAKSAVQVGMELKKDLLKRDIVVD